MDYLLSLAKTGPTKLEGRWVGGYGTHVFPSVSCIVRRTRLIDVRIGMSQATKMKFSMGGDNTASVT